MELISITTSALSSSLVIMIFTWLCYDISGAHFNPAITIGLLVIKKIDWTDFVFYLIAQFFASFIAGFFVYIQLNKQINNYAEGKSQIGIPYQEDPEISSFWAELIGLFIISWVFLSLSQDPLNKKKPLIFGIAIGFIYFVILMTVGRLSGNSLNPARALGPAIITGKIEKRQFIQFFGPITGALLGNLLYSYIFIDDEDDLQDELYNDQNHETGKFLTTNYGE